MKPDYGLMAIIAASALFLLSQLVLKFINARADNQQMFFDKKNLAQSKIESDFYLPKLAQLYEDIREKERTKEVNYSGSSYSIRDLLVSSAYYAEAVRELGDTLEEYGRLDSLYRNLSKVACGVWISFLVFILSFLAYAFPFVTGIPTSANVAFFGVIGSVGSLTSGLLFLISYHLARNRLVKLIEKYSDSRTLGGP